MRIALLIVAFSLATTAAAVAAPSAAAIGGCIDHSPGPIPDCEYYLVCQGNVCIDYPCRYCVPWE